ACGINGDVTFNVAPGSGPYNERVVIPAFTGSGPGARVIFNGNGATVSFDGSVSAQRATIQLDGADYITINGFNIVAENATYGWGIHLFGDTDFNEITNNTISIATTSTTAASSGGIVASGSATSTTTVGAADNNLISGNTISGG